MKHFVLALALIAVAVLVVGCATPYPMGNLYIDLKLPVDATSNAGQATKVGTAECTSILALVAMGDSSIETAKKNGNITKVYHVDWEVENILGIIGNYKVVVYGE